MDFENNKSDVLPTKADANVDAKVDTKADAKVDTKVDTKVDASGNLKECVRVQLSHDELTNAGPYDAAFWENMEFTDEEIAKQKAKTEAELKYWETKFKTLKLETLKDLSN